MVAQTPAALLGVLSLFIVAALSGCSGIKVYTDYDPGLDFSHYDTYAWMPDKTEETGDYRVDNDLVQRRVLQALVNQLELAGFREVSEAEADFWIAYRVDVLDKTQISSSGSYVTYGQGGRGRYGGVGYGGGVDSYDYTEGVLVLDFIDPKTEELVWRGTAERRVDAAKGPQKSEERINLAFAKILERFPPGKERKK